MEERAGQIQVYIEAGNKRTFAGALEWPGWCRQARDEQSALQRLFLYGPRYARALATGRLSFEPPSDASAFSVVERLKGNATTDFGAPAIAPIADNRPVDEPDLERFASILKSCWATLDAAAKTAEGKNLAKGPRGGGRDLHQIVEHVIEAEAAYVSRLGRSEGQPPDRDAKDPARSREAALQAVRGAARNDVGQQGPRGAVRWTPRYFVRRVAWHALDHAWEIEDRVAASTSSPCQSAPDSQASPWTKDRLK